MSYTNHRWERIKNLYKTTPIDALKKNNRVSDEIASKRYNICFSCDFFIKTTTQCRKCGCFMKIKTTILDAECPINKWGKEN